MQDMSRAGRYILFLGAGASRAFGIPGMRDLFDMIDRQIVPGALALDPEPQQDLWVSLRDWQVPGQCDIEEILRALEVAAASEFPSVLVAAYEVMGLRVPESMPRDSHLVRMFQTASETLRARIVDAITSAVRPSPLSAALTQSTYGYLFGALGGLGLSLVATTNYDTVFERCAEHLGLSTCTGFDASDLWGGFTAATKTAASWRVDMAKLHGSVDWYTSARPGGDEVRRTELTVASPQVDSRGRTVFPYLILPGRAKEHSGGYVAEALRRRLWEGLVGAEMAVVVGYSFRDPYLSDIFAKAMAENPDLHLLIVDPDAQRLVDEGLPAPPSERTHALATELGAPGLRRELGSVLSDDLGYRLIVSPSVDLVRYGGRRLKPVHPDARLEADAESFSGSAVVVPDPQRPGHPAAAIYGPYQRLGDEGRYRAFFRLRVEGGDSLPEQEVALVLDVAARRSRESGDLSAYPVSDERPIFGHELVRGRHYQVFALDFDWRPESWRTDSLELRILLPAGDQRPDSWRLSKLAIDSRWVRRLGSIPRQRWVFGNEE